MPASQLEILRAGFCPFKHLGTGQRFGWGGRTRVVCAGRGGEVRKARTGDAHSQVLSSALGRKEVALGRAWSCPDPGAENGERLPTGAESSRLA